MGLRQLNLIYGTDPEGFFSKDGVIVGSEKIIPQAGLKARAIKPHVVLDGVQFELNPPARNSVPLLGREISTAFELLSRQLRKFEGRVKIDWRGLVEVPKDELDSLSSRTRMLGCVESQNIFGARPITVDPLTYRKRSAGGHLHLGLGNYPHLMEDRNRLIGPLAILVANTCVMLDRDPGAAERRENYGRAGEFRTPTHGIEYRTLSNFWLRNYSLMSFVFGMASFAVAVVDLELRGGKNIKAELDSLINIKKIIKAIETNDFNLARANFASLRPFFANHLPKAGFPLSPATLDRFMVFAEGVRKRGIEAFFPDDPTTHWVSGEQTEFSKFLESSY